jgi:cob(I)alamin adenosyltransferase
MSKFKPQEGFAPITDKDSEPTKTVSSSSRVSNISHHSTTNSLSIPIYHGINRSYSPASQASSKSKSPDKKGKDKNPISGGKTGGISGGKADPSGGKTGSDISGDYGETSITNGERLTKNSRIIASRGTLEELISYIGIIKAQHFGNEGATLIIEDSDRMIISAFLTKIQESLYDIITSITTSKANITKHESTRFNGEQRIRELDREIEKMKEEIHINKNSQILIGASILEAQIMHARSIARRTERIVVSARNVRIGIVPEESVTVYLNRLGDYLQFLSLKMLLLQCKEPVKRSGRR